MARLHGVQRQNVAHFQRNGGASCKAERRDRLPDAQRFSGTQHDGIATPCRHAQEAQVVQRIGILIGSFPKAAQAGDPHDIRVADDVAVRHHDRGRNGYSRTHRQRAVFPVGLDPHHAVGERHIHFPARRFIVHACGKRHQSQRTREDAKRHRSAHFLSVAVRGARSAVHAALRGGTVASY